MCCPMWVLSSLVSAALCKDPAEIGVEGSGSRQLLTAGGRVLSLIDDGGTKHKSVPTFQLTAAGGVFASAGGRDTVTVCSAQVHAEGLTPLFIFCSAGNCSAKSAVSRDAAGNPGRHP